jgi:hypothetical protein
MSMYSIKPKMIKSIIQWYLKRLGYWGKLNNDNLL